MNDQQAAPRSTVDEDKARLGYLMDMYKLYHGHINTMFNYFLILAGLIGNAFIVSIQKNEIIANAVPTAIAVIGFLISAITWLIHLRSRALLDTLEARLRAEENVMFHNNAGFLTVPFGTGPFYRRHKYQFQALYAIFCFAFILAALFLHHEQLQKIYAHFCQPNQ